MDTLPFKWHKGFDEKTLPEITSADLPIALLKYAAKDDVLKEIFKVFKKSNI